jgi:thiol-disulfide isomerase/thioredoxin
MKPPILKTDKILLIDFWEVWCGWCIKSFPEVEKLYQTYKEDLEVIGIATESKDKALRLIEEKGITFKNYFQDQDFLNKFNIRSWPTYILVDRNGIMIKEYFGFNEAIETDIKALINAQ